MDDSISSIESAAVKVCFDQSYCARVRLHERHMGGSPTERLDADRTSASKPVNKLNAIYTIIEDIKQCLS
tara:strand:- start:371 stop:580 length:210 start_codon:yes stop_codon:yes gene_type:complete